ncbi:MAG: replication restart helicase PriA [Christensenellales bacterium]
MEGAFARVIVDITHSAVDRVFTYRIPEEMEGQVRPGCRVAVPFGRQPRAEGYVIGLTTVCDLPEDKIRDIEATLDKMPAILPELLEEALEIRRDTHCLLAEALRLMVPSVLRKGLKPKTQEIALLAVSRQEAKAAAEGLRGQRKKIAAAVLDTLCIEDTPMRELRQELRMKPAHWKLLTEMGLVATRTEEISRRPYLRLPAEDAVFLLTGEQKAAVSAIVAASERGEGAFLLRGVTGSGKTEVYMQCARSVLAQGKTVLIMVPEISLTPQMVARFLGRFGPVAAVLHSRLSPGERLDEWLRLRRGEARVCIGARSAVFAPLERLGLLVVDEEHEASYRSEYTPRYDAVEVARQRCLREGATLVLGSATPSVERYYAMEQGEYQLLTMEKRASGMPLPVVSVVDMRQELALGNRSVFSGELALALGECLEAGEQAILFLNRRGYANFVSCRACGQPIRCPHCDLSLTYHQSVRRLICHYCGYEIPMPSRCPQCGSPAIKQFGGGTEKLESEVKRLFPGHSILRMDADTTRGKEGHLPILEAFGKGDAQVLVGTQMIAKGLDFPGVTLVGVMAADQNLYMSDYKSFERTFNLLTQVAGRAGRQNPGRVVVQSYTPGHMAIRYAVMHDYPGFYREEIARRQMLQLPPFSRIIRLLFSHNDGKIAYDAMFRGRQTIEAMITDEEMRRTVIQINGGMAPVERIRDTARAQLLIRLIPGEKATALEEQIAAYVTRETAECRIQLEIQPHSFY